MPKLIMDLWSPNVGDLINRSHESSKPVLEFSPDMIKDWESYLNLVGASSSVIESTKLVINKNSRVLVSGQQVGLGINPLLSIYKLFSLEVLAEYINQKNGENKVVPIFWLQTEDHDLEEILNLNELIRNEKIDYQSFFNSYVKKIEKQSVGSIKHTDYILPLLEKIKSAGLDPEFTEIFENSYLSSDDLGSAFAKFYYSLFPDSKIVFFDIRYKSLNKLKISTFSKAFDESNEIENLLNVTSEELTSKGEKIQVSLKANSPLVFYHPEGKDGSRYRVIKDNHEFVVPETSQKISAVKIIEELKNFPEKFSSSALIRPILQDSIFDPIAYIGGDAELSYLKQINELYAFFQINMPLRIKRPKGIVLDDKIFNQFSNIKAKIFFSSSKTIESSLLKELYPENKEPQSIKSYIFGNYVRQIDEKLTSLLEVDQTLSTPKQKTIQSIEESISKYLDKYKSALIRNEDIYQGRIAKLVQQIYPNGQPQERFISLLQFGLHNGVNAVRDLYFDFKNWSLEHLDELKNE